MNNIQSKFKSQQEERRGRRGSDKRRGEEEKTDLRAPSAQIHLFHSRSSPSIPKLMSTTGPAFRTCSVNGSRSPTCRAT